MAVVHLGHHQAPAVGTTIDRVHAGATVSATVTLRSIRPTHSGRAAGVVTALAGGKSTIVTFSADAYRRHARILTPGTRLIVRGQVTDIDRQRVLDVRAAVEVTV
ncbi:hypothetical protein EAO77_28040 [Streptomyces sp. t39]|nr:hypothetical protein EAO77_28040 [Streptomyces sp. t39]